MWLVFDCNHHTLYNIYNFFFNWWPYITFWSDTVFLQVCVIYLFLLILLSKNIYYVLLYLFIQIFFLGVYLAVFNLEFFTGFLWVIEGTIIFIFLLVLFYVNFKGYINSYDMNIFFYNKVIYSLVLAYFSLLVYSMEESYILDTLITTHIWDDFYEATYNSNMNEFTQLLLSYYSFNSLGFVIIGIILLVGSVVCVNLYRVNKNFSLYSYNGFFSFFSFFSDLVSYSFIRKQNLHNQNLGVPSTKLFKKKN